MRSAIGLQSRTTTAKPSGVKADAAIQQTYNGRKKIAGGRECRLRLRCSLILGFSRIVDTYTRMYVEGVLTKQIHEEGVWAGG